MVNPSQLSQMQSIYQKQDRDRYYYGSESDTTPDGQYTVRTGYESAGCMSDGRSWVTVTDSSGQTVYQYEKKHDRSFSHPTITPDGSRVYVQQEKNGKYCTLELPVKDAGPLRRLRGAKAIFEEKVDALQMSPDGTKLAIAKDGDACVWDRPKGFLSGLWSVSPHAVAKVGERINELHYLDDGSLFVVPDSWERRTWLVSANHFNVDRVPLRQMDEGRWKSQIRSIANWIPSATFDQFAKNPDWIANDEGIVKPHHAKASPDGKDVAVVLHNESRSELTLFDTKTAATRHVADLPLADENANRFVNWSKDGSSVLVFAHHWNDPGEAVLADVKTGESWHFDGVDGPESCQASPDGQQLATVSRGRRSLMIWDRNTRKVQELPIEKETSKTQIDKVSVEWLPQGTHAVVVSRPAGMRSDEVHVISKDGAEHKSIPAIESAALEDSVLKFRIGGIEHELDLPEGLATLEQQPWYVSPDTGALFGGGARKDDLKVERGDGQVSVGGIVVPVRGNVKETS